MLFIDICYYYLCCVSYDIIMGCLPVAESVETFLPPALRNSMPLEQQLQILLDKLDRAEALRKSRRFDLCLLFDKYGLFSHL